MAAVCTTVGRVLNERCKESMGIMALARRLKKEDDRRVSDNLKDDGIVNHKTKKATRFKRRPRVTLQDRLDRDTWADCWTSYRRPA